MTPTEINLAKNLESISWNRANIFPASSYLATSLKTLGCREVHYKLYKLPDGNFDITLEYKLDDAHECHNFHCIKSSKSTRTESAYARLLCSRAFKTHCLSRFNIDLPLPSVWDVDGLRLHANDDFLANQKVFSNKDLATLLSKLHNLETRVSTLEHKVSH